MNKLSVLNILDRKRNRHIAATHFLWEIEKISPPSPSGAKKYQYQDDFLITRLVTILEVFTRDTIQVLVDYGPPFRDRAEFSTRGMKIDLLFASHIQGKTISFGDVVSHTISISSIEGIISAFEDIVPDFATSVRNSYPRYIEEKDSWPLPPIIEDWPTTMDHLRRLFASRHILVHELRRHRPYEESEIANFVSAVHQFVDATEWTIIEQIHQAIPKTQETMTEIAATELLQLEQQLHELIETLTNSAGVDSSLVIRSQQAWSSYADHETELRASVVDGGTMQPLLRATEKAKLVKLRIENLQAWIDSGELDM